MSSSAGKELAMPSVRWALRAATSKPRPQPSPRPLFCGLVCTRRTLLLGKGPVQVAERLAGRLGHGARHLQGDPRLRLQLIPVVHERPPMLREHPIGLLFAVLHLRERRLRRFGLSDAGSFRGVVVVLVVLGVVGVVGIIRRSILDVLETGPELQRLCQRREMQRALVKHADGVVALGRTRAAPQQLLPRLDVAIRVPIKVLSLGVQRHGQLQHAVLWLHSGRQVRRLGQLVHSTRAQGELQQRQPARQRIADEHGDLAHHRVARVLHGAHSGACGAKGPQITTERILSSLIDNVNQFSIALVHTVQDRYGVAQENRK
eukprot:scaffold1790_cov257-Pinguiococcus_pyrenoidosus.AAC.12